LITIRIADWTEPEDREALKAIRLEVFVREQGVPEVEEMDAFDNESTHLLATTETKALVGCARLMKTGQIGRMAVQREQRGQGIGGMLLDAAITEARRRGRAQIFLHAQRHAESFYARFGFHRVGSIFSEADIEHVKMVLHE
jgi:predicted GNAT family N-acyltransferase